MFGGSLGSIHDDLLNAQVKMKINQLTMWNQRLQYNTYVIGE
jgi:hypothetical protein